MNPEPAVLTQLKTLRLGGSLERLDLSRLQKTSRPPSVSWSSSNYSCGDELERRENKKLR